MLTMVFDHDKVMNVVEKHMRIASENIKKDFKKLLTMIESSGSIF